MREWAALYRLLPGARRRQLFITLLLMVAGAVAEMMTVGAVLPFLAFASGSGGALIPDAVAEWLGWFGGSALGGAAILLVSAGLLSAGVRLLLAWQSQRLVMMTGADLAGTIFARSLALPYAEQVQRHSSRTLTDIDQVQQVVYHVLLPGMQAVSALVIGTCIAALLFLIDPFTAGVGAAAVGLVYLAVTLVTQPALRRNALDLSATAVARVRLVQEALSGVRDIILDRSEAEVSARFRAVDRRYRRAQARNNFLAASARYPIEAAAIAALAAVTLALSARPGGFAAAIPLLGAFALGAQRLLPLLQTAYAGISHATGNFRSFSDVIAAAQLPVPPQPEQRPPLRFENIAFDRVGYRHPAANFALEGLSFRIERGERVGVSGATGSGKSTLLDLMMGLLAPQQGEVRVNGKPLEAASMPGWQAALAHVPQSIFLADDSIAANIAFPRPLEELDPACLERAVRAAALEPFVASLPDGPATRVGERGIKLSGGQRQRIGLARALAREPQLLILDEATSSLDAATEAEVLAALAEMEELTVIMVAHRGSTLANCERLLELDGGTLVAREDRAVFGAV